MRNDSGLIHNIKPYNKREKSNVPNDGKRRAAYVDYRLSFRTMTMLVKRSKANVILSYTWDVAITVEDIVNVNVMNCYSLLHP